MVIEDISDRLPCLVILKNAMSVDKIDQHAPGQDKRIKSRKRKLTLTIKFNSIFTPTSEVHVEDDFQILHKQPEKLSSNCL